MSSGALMGLVLALAMSGGEADAPRPFAIEVVDEATGRGVPLVELRTVNHVLYVTDSAGLAVIDEPALVGQKVYFHVRSHGYEFPADGFGYRGQALEIVPGQTATLKLRRINVAERLYRVTGVDIYRDSLLAGRAAPISKPLVNAQVAGSDSVNSVVYRGRLYWFWGDTNRLAYPLGMFHVPGATSKLPPDGGLSPERGVDLEYFTRDDGFVANTCQMPGDGPTWIDGLCVIREADGRERMFAKYVKVRKFLEVYERGLVEFDGDTARFKKVTTFDFAAPLYPLGHALPHEVDQREFVYFGNPYPLVRVPATAMALADPRAYETFTCLAPGSSLEKPSIDRDEHGAVRWSWKSGVAAPTAGEQAKWLKRRLLKDEEALLALCDVDSGKRVVAHAGSVSWNAFRRRYVMIVEEIEGTSYLGEIWFAEADSPVGPWVYARKIVTHDKYSFYNPRHHPMLDEKAGRRIYFEGTYSTFFTGIDAPTPRYDYNQIMYALDLDDPRVVLPVAIYETSGDGQQTFSANSPTVDSRIAFMALDRPSDGTVAVVRRKKERGQWELIARPDLAERQESNAVSPPHPGPLPRGEREEEILFYALPADAKSPPKTAVALYEWTHKTNGARRYAPEGEPAPADYERAEKPLCLVWRYPLSPAIRFDEP